MGEETKVTVKFWAVILVMLGIIGWIGATVFANTGKIVRLETGLQHMQETALEIKLGIREIRSDLKEHVVFTRNGGIKSK
jgi:hypothetical protein